MRSAFSVALVLIAGGAFFLGARSSRQVDLPASPAVQEAAAVPAIAPAPRATIIAVGDVMVGRFVESLMEEQGADHLFGGVSALLSGDLVIGNLEGPIRTDHEQTPINSLRFDFVSSTAALLRAKGFTHLTLGNNHTGDHGAEGLRETRDHLRSAGIVPVGDPGNIDGAYVATTSVNGIDLALFSMNDTWKKRPADEIMARVGKVRAASPGAFLIALVHWGDEYVLTPNGRQREVAAAIVRGGANLVVGHHPHVIESVDMVGGAPVFYSLGNFIFDQYFSREVQEELLLAITVGRDSAEYRLVPLLSERSRPRPADGEDRERVLGALADRSGEGIREGVRAGYFTIQY